MRCSSRRRAAGKQVLRLKGGDPFLFGRGGEEALALAEAGLAFDIVPGVTSAIAAPAYAGIPVTHREHTSQLTIFTGHEDPSKPESALDYQRLATQPGTKVMLMGVERIGPITEALQAHGASTDLPVALIRWGTTGRQQTLRGTIGDIAKKVAEADFSAPAVAVFGEVVGLREKLNWFEKRPLFGKRIAVTRTRQQAGGLIAALRALGADAFEMPTIRIEPPLDRLAFGELVQDSHQYDWLIFTSPNGVTAFFDLFFKIYKDAREIGGVRIAAIGPATAQRVRDFHLAVDLQPAEYVAEAIIAALKEVGSVENERFLLVRAEQARDVLPKELSRLGAIVDEAIAYRTVPETEDVGGGLARFKAEGADLITFTSSSTVENFLALKLPLPEGLQTASIGPITSQTMREAWAARGSGGEAVRYSRSGSGDPEAFSHSCVDRPAKALGQNLPFGCKFLPESLMTTQSGPFLMRDWLARWSAFVTFSQFLRPEFADCTRLGKELAW